MINDFVGLFIAGVIILFIFMAGRAFRALSDGQGLGCGFCIVFLAAICLLVAGLMNHSAAALLVGVMITLFCLGAFFG